MAHTSVQVLAKRWDDAKLLTLLLLCVCFFTKFLFCMRCFTCRFSFHLQALQPFTSGTEVTISYGAIKPNAECLRDYGFIVPGVLRCAVLCCARAPCTRLCLSQAAARG